VQLAASGQAPAIDLVMVEAVLDDGARLVALNEVFVGHRSHQSARYRVVVGGRELHQISSGLIVATGTGATGWARSVSIERRCQISLPGPRDDRLAFFVREPFPASGSDISISEGLLARQDRLVAWSEMDTGGTIFGDGIEADALPFDWGRRVEVHAAEQRLHLITE
jgi:hypothetical protein